MLNFVLIDQKFDKIVDQMDMTVVNMTGAREHVIGAERGICTIKDSSRCTVAELRGLASSIYPSK